MTDVHPHPKLDKALRAADLTNVQILGFIDQVATFDVIPADKWDATANVIFEHLGGTKIEPSDGRDGIYYIHMPDGEYGPYGYTLIFCDMFDPDDVHGSVLVWNDE